MEESLLKERVQKLGPWFHKVDLGNGVTTKTESVFGEPADHPLTTWEYVKRVLPEDLKGKSVLDIGCNGGFYAAEAAKRGGQVLGVEAKGHHVAQAQFVNEVLGLDMRFRKGSLYDLNPAVDGQFDLVLCLGVIYHLKHLVAGIERLFLMTRDQLILETAIACDENLKTVESFHFADNERSLHPLFFVENPIDSNEAAFNWFLPTAPCVQALLRSVGFVDVSEPILFRDRAVITARKAADFHSPEVASSLAAEIRPAQNAYHIRQGERLRIPIVARNTGLARWSAAGDENGKGRVRLTAHYLTAEGVDLWRDVATVLMDRDIIPGDEAALELDLHSPPEPGHYMIELDMLSEFVAHFEINGSPTAKIHLTVA
jgi:tRNA (mo5U34)-methyltransferase